MNLNAIGFALSAVILVAVSNPGYGSTNTSSEPPPLVSGTLTNIIYGANGLSVGGNIRSSNCEKLGNITRVTISASGGNIQNVRCVIRYSEKFSTESKEVCDAANANMVDAAVCMPTSESGYDQMEFDYDGSNFLYNTRKISGDIPASCPNFRGEWRIVDGDSLLGRSGYLIEQEGCKRTTVDITNYYSASVERLGEFINDNSTTNNGWISNFGWLRNRTKDYSNIWSISPVALGLNKPWWYLFEISEDGRLSVSKMSYENVEFQKWTYKKVSSPCRVWTDCHTPRARRPQTVPAPKFTDILRNADGTIAYMDQKAAAKFCKNKGMHLPSIRDIGLMMMSRGAEGIYELDEVRQINENGESLGTHIYYSSNNSNGIIDRFYFVETGYKMPPDQKGVNFWSSSYFSNPSNTYFFLDREKSPIVSFGTYSFNVTGRIGVRCVIPK